MCLCVVCVYVCVHVRVCFSSDISFKVVHEGNPLRIEFETRRRQTYDALARVARAFFSAHKHELSVWFLNLCRQPLVFTGALLDVFEVANVDIELRYVFLGCHAP